MGRLDVMRPFTRIVERRSFTVAAQDLEVPRSTVTSHALSGPWARCLSRSNHAFAAPCTELGAGGSAI